MNKWIWITGGIGVLGFLGINIYYGAREKRTQQLADRLEEAMTGLRDKVSPEQMQVVMHAAKLTAKYTRGWEIDPKEAETQLNILLNIIAQYYPQQFGDVQYNKDLLWYYMEKRRKERLQQQ